MWTLPDASFSMYYQELCEVTCMFLKLLMLHASAFKYYILVKHRRHYVQMKLVIQEKTEQDIKNAGTNSVEISLTYTYIKPQRLIHDTKIMTSKHVTMLPALTELRIWCQSQMPPRL